MDSAPNRNKDFTLPSGAKLHLTIAPFADAKELYQSVLEEAKNLKIDLKTEIDLNLRKDLICTALSSKKIEQCVWKCFGRVTYNGLKIDSETFEPVDARDDYFEVLWIVAKENIAPFLKSLSAKYGTLLKVLSEDLA